MRALEKTINHVIANGAKIAENGLGTILATEAQLAKADAHADRLAREDQKHGNETLGLCNLRHVDGENRWYQSPTRYAIVRNKRVRWFTIRPDGHTYAER